MPGVRQGPRVTGGAREPQDAGIVAGKRWRVFWHSLFYVLLAYAVFAAVQGRPLAAGWLAPRLGLAVLLGAWYGYWQVARSSGGRLGLVYLAGAVALLIPLMALAPGSVVLGLAVFAPYCLHDLRFGATAILLAAGWWVWQLSAGHGRITWLAVAGVSAVTAGGLLSVGYVSAVVRRSRQRQRLIDELRAARAQLAATERRAGMLEERQRLARDIHDTLTQGFASIAMLLEAARPSLAGHPAARSVGSALHSARENLAESRRLVWALRPGQLANETLPEALAALAKRLSEENGTHAEMVVAGTARPLGEAVETALLRATQEALANIRKHAGASHVTVTISYFDDLAVLDIQDDGAGFDPASQASAGAAGGTGLPSMRQRIGGLGGTVEVESAPGEGTTVVISLPAGVPQEPVLHPARGSG